MNRERPKLTIRTLLLSIIGVAFVATIAHADEGGASFWLPGQFGSLAAVPGEAGWSLPLIYYHASQNAGDSAEFSTGGRITLGLDVSQDLLMFVPTYVFAKPVWGGQASLSMAGVYGKVDVSVDATLTGPGGNIISGRDSDSLTAFGDLFPQFSVKWNHGVHNSMVYTMLGVPVGSYEAERLANIGTNHWSADVGAGYTYFNPDTGREFSATAGVSYSFENADTKYQNGISAHLDWGLTQFVSEQWHLGLAGYFYHQLTGDSGAGADLGDFKSQVNGIGPQAGYLFAMGDGDAYFNAKVYWEFDSKYRAADWNGWVTLAIPF